MIAIYARQSVDKKDSISIEGQIDFCKKEISDENYKVYSDKGFSGKDINRPAFERMMNDIENGKFEKVVVYRLDRISRSLLDFANVIDRFQNNNVEFISCTEKFDTSSPMGRAMLNIIMVFAQLERETIQQRIKDNYYLRAKKGYFLGGAVPYGFKPSKEKIQIGDIKTKILEEDPEKAKNIIKMYELYADTNMSLGKVRDYLNDRNIPSPKGKYWRSERISGMLKNPVYVKADADVYIYYKEKGAIINNELSDFIGENGCYLFGKRGSNERKFTNVEGEVLAIAPHKGLIDSKTWLKCQHKLDNNKQVKNSGKGKYSWLSGRIKCGYCGYSVSVVVSESKAKYKYFKCRGKYNLKICDGFSRVIKMEEVEEVVKKDLMEVISEHKESLDSDVIEEENNDSNYNKYKLEIIEIDNKIENLINQMAEGSDITTSYINKKINELDNRKQELIGKMKNKSSNSNVEKESVFQMVEDWNNLSIEDKKLVCSYYIDKIKIKDNTIEINWKV